jgi:phosphate transport system permease protein
LASRSLKEFKLKEGKMITAKGIASRRIKDYLIKGLVILFAAISVVPLVLILYYIFRQGVAAINWDFFTQLPKPVGETGGGIANALLGSLMIILVATIIAVPFGVSIGIYLSEKGNQFLANQTRLVVDALQGVPSIVIGIVVYIWVVQPMGGFSALSGSIALAIMMVPIISRSTEETLKLIPDTMKEASLALGVPYYKTILRVIVPSGLSGILSGIILSIARITGETAPLLFTAFGNPFINLNILKPMHSLPLLIFNYSTSPYDDWHRLAWGAAFVLMAFVLLLNIVTKIASRKWKVQY